MDKDSGKSAPEHLGQPAADAVSATAKAQPRYIALGFFAVLFFGLLLAPLLSALFQLLMQSTGDGPALAVVQIITVIAQPVLLLLSLGLSIAALVVGKQRNDAKLINLGKGGLAAFAAAILLALLLFGTCMVMLGTGGL